MREPRIWLPFVVLLVLLALVSFFGPSHGITDEMSYLLGVASFLFGIFSSFAINHLWTRLDSIRRELNQETATLNSLYDLAEMFGKDYQNKMADLIDKYLIATMEVPLDQYEYSANAYRKICELAKRADVKTEKQGQAFFHMLGLIGIMSETRVKTTFFGKTKLLSYLSLPTFILGGIILILIIYTKSSTILSSILTLLLSAVAVLVMLVVQDLNRLRPWEDVLFEVGVGQTFDLIKRLRYYEPALIESGRQIPRPGEKYRTKDSKNRLVVKTWPK